MAEKTIKRRDLNQDLDYYLGVDGGGSSTAAALMTGNREIAAEGFAGPSNPLRVGVENAVKNIIAAVDAARDAADVSVGEIGAATLGLAGVRRVDFRDRIRERFISHYGIRDTVVTTDAEIALYGTTSGKPGIVVIAGTGSICMGIDAAGRKFTAGGWGPIAGDEGGGRGIAGDALHRIAKAIDGRGKSTELIGRAIEYFRVSKPENLIGAIYSPNMDNRKIAGFARVVAETALDGDSVATEIMNDAGRELGIAATAVLRELGLDKQKVPVGYVGGVFRSGDLVLGSMVEVIRKAVPKAYIIEPELKPFHAAALMALERAKTA